MKLKAIYDPAELAEYKAAKARGETPAKEPRTTHVEVVHTGASPEQNFDDQLIDDGKLEGWAAVSGKKLTLKTDGEPLVYDVKRGPGYFCKSTGEDIPISQKAWYRFRFASDSTLSRPEALAWLAKHGKQPDDYGISVTYQCVLNAKQHEQFHAAVDEIGELVSANATKEA